MAAASLAYQLTASAATTITTGFSATTSPLVQHHQFANISNTLPAILQPSIILSSAVKEKTSAVKQKTSAVKQKTSSVKQKTSAVKDKTSAVNVFDSRQLFKTHNINNLN